MMTQSMLEPDSRAQLDSEQLCLFVQSAPTAMAMLDREMRYLAASVRWLSDYDLVGVDVRGRSHYEIFPEIPARWKEIHRRCLNGAVERCEEDLFTRADNSQQCLRWEVRPWCARDGSIQGIIIFTEDITERKQAEAELRKSEERFRKIFDYATTGIAITDCAGRFQQCNPAYCDLLGYTEEEFRSLDFAALVHPDDRAANLAAVERLQAGQIPFFELEHRDLHKDGRTVWVHKFGSVLPDKSGEPAQLVVMATDITERRLTEARLRGGLEERLRLLWQAADILLMADRPDAMLQNVFDLLAPHLGLDAYFNFIADEASGNLQLQSCNGISEPAKQSLLLLKPGQAICGKAYAQGHSIVASEIQTSDAPEVQLVKGLGIQAYACNLLKVGDKVLGTLSFASRSKNRFNAEEVEFMETISRYVAVAFERMRFAQQIVESDRRKDEFIATLAHELRNPLAPIRNAVTLLERRILQDSSLQRVHDVIDQQLDYITRLVDDLLDVSRITHGKLQLRLERLCLTDEINAAIDNSQPLIKAKHHGFTVALPKEPIFLNGDLVRLTQAFANLLNNAAKYTPAGGKLRLEANLDGANIQVCVVDNGIGVAADHIPKLFDRFYQANRNYEQVKEGLGLGLTLVKQLVLMHGGSVAVRSDGPNCGSEFSVVLPVLNEPSASRSVEYVSEPSVTRRCRVLIADDHQGFCSTLGELLEFDDNEVRIAHDGREALEMAAEFQPDAVLLDIGMPRLNGYETARRLREKPWGANLLLVAITGWGDEDAHARCIAAGFDVHLVKPIIYRELAEILAKFEYKKSVIDKSPAPAV